MDLLFDAPGKATGFSPVYLIVKEIRFAEGAGGLQLFSSFLICRMASDVIYVYRYDYWVVRKFRKDARFFLLKVNKSV